MATLSGTIPGMAAIAAGVPLKFKGQSQGLSGISSALGRQVKEQNALANAMDARTSQLLSQGQPGLINPATQPYSNAVQSRLAALAGAMPGRAGMRNPGLTGAQPRMQAIFNRARMDAMDQATQGAAQGAEEQRARQLGEMDFSRRMFAKIAEDRAKNYEQEQNTRGMRGISERNIGSTLQDVGRAMLQSGGII